MTSKKIMCANCRTLATKENIKVVKGFCICLCCLEYNNINYEALKQDKVIFSDKMSELIRQREQEKRGEIKVFY